MSFSAGNRILADATHMGNKVSLHYIERIHENSISVVLALFFFLMISQVETFTVRPSVSPYIYIYISATVASLFVYWLFYIMNCTYHSACDDSCLTGLSYNIAVYFLDSRQILLFRVKAAKKRWKMPTECNGATSSTEEKVNILKYIWRRARLEAESHFFLGLHVRNFTLLPLYSPFWHLKI